METIDIITLVAIILFARLGVRLVMRYLRDRNGGAGGEGNEGQDREPEA